MALNNYLSKEYVDNLVSSIGLSFSEQTHITGATVTVNDLVTILYVDPVSNLSTLTITLAASPVNGQELKISFGGTLSAGAVVVNTLVIQGNTGHTVLAGSSITKADVGDGHILKFQQSINTWRVF